MARQTQFIQLSEEDRRSLKTLFRTGRGANRLQTRARILDLLDREVPPPEIALTLSCGIATVYNVKRRDLAAGLDAALSDKPRSGAPRRISGQARAQLTALACSAAPVRTRAGRCACWLTAASNSASVKASRITQSKRF
jgi:hypothetical protein